MGETSLGDTLVVVLSFLILLYLLKKFAWTAIVKMMDDRAEKIANDLDTAESSRIEANRLAVERKKELAASKSDAMDIVNRAKDSGDKRYQEIVNEAQSAAQTLKEKTNQDIEVAKAEALADAKGEIANISLQIAEKLLQKELTADKHASLIDSYIEGLGNSHEPK